MFEKIFKKGYAIDKDSSEKGMSLLRNPSNSEIKDLLTNAKTIAVVGLSDQPHRTSYQVSKIMQRQGYKIIPVNPNASEILGEKAYNSLDEINEPIDIINVFRRSEHLEDVAKDAIKTDCKVYWAQLGLSNEKAYELLKEHNFTVIMDLCIKVEYSRLVGN